MVCFGNNLKQLEINRFSKGVGYNNAPCYQITQGRVVPSNFDVAIYRRFMEKAFVEE